MRTGTPTPYFFMSVQINRNQLLSVLELSNGRNFLQHDAEPGRTDGRECPGNTCCESIGRTNGAEDSEGHGR